jgi:hypothetical protein
MPLHEILHDNAQYFSILCVLGRRRFHHATPYGVSSTWIFTKRATMSGAKCDLKVNPRTAGTAVRANAAHVDWTHSAHTATHTATADTVTSWATPQSTGFLISQLKKELAIALMMVFAYAIHMPYIRHIYAIY